MKGGAAEGHSLQEQHGVQGLPTDEMADDSYALHRCSKGRPTASWSSSKLEVACLPCCGAWASAS